MAKKQQLARWTGAAVAAGLFLGAGAAAPALAAPASSGVVGQGVGQQLSFRGFTQIAIAKAQALYPGARFYEAAGTAPVPGQDLRSVTQWRFVFGLPHGGTLFLTSSIWGEFAPPVVDPRHWLGDQAMEWPVKLDLDQAATILRKAGYDGEFLFVTLRQPLYVGMYEPYFIFTLPGDRHIAVGATDGVVTEFHH